MKIIEVDEAKLNSTELVILNKINEDPNFFCSSNILDLSKKYNVSTSTITRVCKKFGFKSLKHTQLSVNERIVLKHELYKFDESGTTEALMNNIKSSILYTINETFQVNNKTILENIALQITTCDRIIIYGFEDKKYGPSIFVDKLQSININSFFVANSYDYILRTMYSTKKTIAFIVLREKPWSEIYKLIKWTIDDRKIQLFLISPNVEKTQSELLKMKILMRNIRILSCKNSINNKSNKMNDVFMISGDSIIFETIYQTMIHLKPKLEDKINSISELYDNLVGDNNEQK